MHIAGLLCGSHALMYANGVYPAFQITIVLAFEDRFNSGDQLLAIGPTFASPTRARSCREAARGPNHVLKACRQI